MRVSRRGIDSSGALFHPHSVSILMDFRIAGAMVAVLLQAANPASGAGGDAIDGIFAGVEPIVHVRTYYWDSTNTKGVPSEAWALGGWAGLKTRWYGEILQLGVLGYTSQRLYGPADQSGSLLLGPGQDPINVLGQAYGSLRFAGQTVTAYRQMIDQPWVNPQDSRMIPNLFEGYLLSGKVRDLEYVGGYVTKVKTRGSDAFQSMSGAAGSSGPQQGMVLFGARVLFADEAQVRIAEQYLTDTFNTAYVDAEYAVAIDAGGRLRLGVQYANQQSVGSDGIGVFNTSMYGVRGQWANGPFSFQAAWTQTSRNHETLNPFGDNPSFLNLMQVAFSNAGEKAWLIGGSLDFAQFGAPGMNAIVNYASSRGSIDPSTGAALGDRNETDVKLAYGFDSTSGWRGLSFGIEGSWLNQAGAAAQARQLRVFANYEVPFELQ